MVGCNPKKTLPSEAIRPSLGVGRFTPCTSKHLLRWCFIPQTHISWGEVGWLFRGLGGSGMTPTEPGILEDFGCPGTMFRLRSVRIVWSQLNQLNSNLLCSFWGQNQLDSIPKEQPKPLQNRLPKEDTIKPCKNFHWFEVLPLLVSKRPNTLSHHLLRAPSNECMKVLIQRAETATERVMGWLMKISQPYDSPKKNMGFCNETSQAMV